jgi:hypothetical protein
MMSPVEKAQHAYEEDALVDLLMGKWPYFEPADYMAPSNVPTNWERILQGLSEATAIVPNLSTSVNAALNSMTGSAESAYCALEVVLHYLDGRAWFSPDFVVDWNHLVDRLRQDLPALQVEAQSMHLDWMGPTNETLLERINIVRQVLDNAHGIRV